MRPARLYPQALLGGAVAEAAFLLIVYVASVLASLVSHHLLERPLGTACGSPPSHNIAASQHGCRPCVSLLHGGHGLQVMRRCQIGMEDIVP
jgi:peptidoglycan/LPS O-acetylase OafA/YrhL